MKISVDGGGLCSGNSNRFGNFIFSKNLITALQKYDKKNNYFIYSFCKKPVFIKNTNNFRFQNLQPKFFWSAFRTSVAEIEEKKDYFLGLNQSIPMFSKAKVISFSHGLSYYFFPKLYRDSQARLKHQLKRMINLSEKIIVSSIKVKNELMMINQKIKNKIVVIPYGVPLDMRKKKSKGREKFFLVVGMDHPIKNFKVLPKNKYKFIIANHVNRSQLKKLYSQATALVTTSLYESFNLPVLEALAQGCPVIGFKSAIIPELVEYVNVVENEKQLLTFLDKALAKKLKPVNSNEINKKFNWKNYVSRLIQQYH